MTCSFGLQAIPESLFWEDKLSSKIQGLLPLERQYNLNQFDYFVFYNVTLDEYNQYPPNGEYECIFIAYDCELQRFIILDDWKVNGYHRHEILFEEYEENDYANLLTKMLHFYFAAYKEDALQFLKIMLVTFIYLNRQKNIWD